MNQISQEIRALCKEHDAVILAHYYVEGDVQDIADYVGDSYYLAKVARENPHQTIVFCGVTFMGESACILNPDKTILIPDENAVCPMALMADAESIRSMRAKYEDLAVVCYINSMANIKALSDVCVTSSNALKIVRALPNRNIFFIPDANLGRHIASQVPDKNIILNPGYCHVHTSITAEDVVQAFRMHPNARILVHPECTQEVCELADYIGSTKDIIDYAAADDANEFIVCTESGVLHELQKKAPGKAFYFIGAKQICPNMKRITLEKVRGCLRTGMPKAVMSKDMRLQACTPLDRMLALAK